MKFSLGGFFFYLLLGLFFLKGLGIPFAFHEFSFYVKWVLWAGILLLMILDWFLNLIGISVSVSY